MPRYKIGNGSFEHTPIFDNHHDMMLFLSRVDKNHPEWQEYFVQKSKDYLSGKRVPPTQISTHALRKIIHKHPYQLVHDVIRESKIPTDELIGGGISEAIHTLAGGLANITGISYLKEKLSGKANHKTIPREMQYFAKALKNTYQSKEDRSKSIGDLTRIPELDTSRYSVWMQPNKQLLVTVHGTKLDFEDISDDLSILGGDTSVESEELNKLLEQLDSLNVTYDIAAHSLATEFSNNSLTNNSHVDNIYYFNPASSPFQNREILEERANDDKIQYFINPSDIISSGLYQKMNNATIDRSFIGNYRWSPLSSHSLEQWYPDLEDSETEGVPPTKSSEEDGDGGAKGKM